MSRTLKRNFAGVITGASTGIGKALAVKLAEEFKAFLVISARSEDKLNETKTLIESHGGSAVTVCGDIGDKDMPQKLVDKCIESFGSIDLLVNNAGLAVPGSITKLTPQDWERVFAVNFFAPLYGTYAALPHFLANGGGKIVNISSVAGKVSFPGSVCYAASKFALTGMSEGMAAELSGKDVDIITVCPGWVRTEFFEKNNIIDSKNPTMIAQRGGLSAAVMKHLLSISSEQTAGSIMRALRKNGSTEMVLTLPGIAVERINAICPIAISTVLKYLPSKLVDASR